MITLVIFSKDRAMQLDSLLRSVKDHCTGIDRVTVLYVGSTDLHFRAYQRVAQVDDISLTMYPQHSVTLGTALNDVVRAPDHIALAVDDMIFYRESDFAWAAKKLSIHGLSWSWRLGEKPDPDHDRFDDHDHWMYSSMLTEDPDYSYMFHSDGMLIKTGDYVKMLDRYLPDWRTGTYTPNDLEAAVAVNKSRWAAAVYPHLGPLKPTCITWQLNRVQTKYGSPAAEIPETNTDALAQQYLEGKRVDNEKLYAMLQTDALRFNPPGARPTHVYASEEASKVWASCIE